LKQLIRDPGGHLRPDPVSSSVLEKYGLEAALEIALFELSHFQAIKDLIKKENIDCELTFTEACWDVTKDEEMSLRIQKIFERLNNSGLDVFKDLKYTHGNLAPEVRSYVPSYLELTSDHNRSAESKVPLAVSENQRRISIHTNL
jgi:hypothetical protein